VKRVSIEGHAHNESAAGGMRKAFCICRVPPAATLCASEKHAQVTHDHWRRAGDDLSVGKVGTDAASQVTAKRVGPPVSDAVFGGSCAEEQVPLG